MRRTSWLIVVGCYICLAAGLTAWLALGWDISGGRGGRAAAPALFGLFSVGLSAVSLGVLGAVLAGMAGPSGRGRRLMLALWLAGFLCFLGALAALALAGFAGGGRYVFLLAGILVMAVGAAGAAMLSGRPAVAPRGRSRQRDA